MIEVPFLSLAFSLGIRRQRLDIGAIQVKDDEAGTVCLVAAGQLCDGLFPRSSRL